ncbi:hypothetical protein BJ165DRAFT_1440558 [Panaeolus papilionaceus]|nr:hypothetical protein BJ165DRAFT_1440558 [Panaeolus papilionaceus]
MSFGTHTSSPEPEWLPYTDPAFSLTHNKDPMAYQSGLNNYVELHSPEDLTQSEVGSQSDDAWWTWPTYAQSSSAPSLSSITPQHSYSNPILLAGEHVSHVVNAAHSAQPFSVAPSFLPNSHPAHDPDIILVSLDNVTFHVNRAKILSRSPRAFETMLGSHAPLISVQKHTTFMLDIPSNILNIIMHLVYDTSPTSNESRTLDTIIQAVNLMPPLDMAPNDHIHPNCPIYLLLVVYAPLKPMDVYCLAGRHRLEELAGQCLRYILSESFTLFNISDDQATSMGATALKRLYVLYQHRITSLRKILFKAPEFHAETEKCDFEGQKTVSRAWGLAIGSILWNEPPDVSSQALQSSLGSLAEIVSCEHCKQAIQDRIKEVLVQWMDAKHITRV